MSPTENSEPGVEETTRTPERPENMMVLDLRSQRENRTSTEIIISPVMNSPVNGQPPGDISSQDITAMSDTVPNQDQQAHYTTIASETDSEYGSTIQSDSPREACLSDFENFRDNPSEIYRRGSNSGSISYLDATMTPQRFVEDPTNAVQSETNNTLSECSGSTFSLLSGMNLNSSFVDAISPNSFSEILRSFPSPHQGFPLNFRSLEPMQPVNANIVQQGVSTTQGTSRWADFQSMMSPERVAPLGAPVSIDALRSTPLPNGDSTQGSETSAQIGKKMETKPALRNICIS